MKRVLKIVMVFLVLVLPVLPVHSARTDISGERAAIEATCPEIVKAAWENVDRLCVDAGRNKACYGHVLLNAQPQPHVQHFAFDQEGQIVDVIDLQSLRLSTMDMLNGYWGVALMRIQANLPASTPDKNVSLLLFGDVEIESGGEALAVAEVVNDSRFNAINVRYRPTTQSPVIGVLRDGEIVTATGRLPDSSWVRVQLPDRATAGWISAPLIAAADGDDEAIQSLAEVTPESTYYGPMQAFYFQSGLNDAVCPEAPNSGILIQTPEGVAEITLLINEVDIQMGSTVYFQGYEDSDMTISVVEGHAIVTAQGETRMAVAGTRISVPMGEGMVPAGPPSPPVPYDMSELMALPVSVMGRPVTVAEPLSAEDLEVLLATPVPTDTDGDGVLDAPSDLPPGLVDNPGLPEGVLPPGHGGSPPGQEDKDKKDKEDKDKDG